MYPMICISLLLKLELTGHCPPALAKLSRHRNTYYFILYTLVDKNKPSTIVYKIETLKRTQRMSTNARRFFPFARRWYDLKIMGKKSPQFFHKYVCPVCIYFFIIYVKRFRFLLSDNSQVCCKRSISLETFKLINWFLLMTFLLLLEYLFHACFHFNFY